MMTSISKISRRFFQSDRFRSYFYNVYFPNLTLVVLFVFFELLLFFSCNIQKLQKDIFNEVYETNKKLSMQKEDISIYI